MQVDEVFEVQIELIHNKGSCSFGAVHIIYCNNKGVKIRRMPMTFVVTDICIRCKYTDCVEVCPVDCFYEGENMLVINPDECIDCGVCEPECPISAIIPDSEPEADKWVEINRDYSEKWPNITEVRSPMAEAEEMKDVGGKFEKYFSENPGDGD